MSFFQMILFPFSWLLNFFYSFTGSYGLALILFAVVVKLILFPFSLKGKRSMIQMNMLSGQMQKLQKQYGRDRERYNAEVQKLYEREKVNPMGGCLWSFIPLLILLPLYAIVRRPLYYTMGLTEAQISQIAQAVDWNNVAVDMGWIKSATDTFSSGGYNELFLSSLINDSNLAALKDMLGEGTRLFALNFDFLGIDLSQVPQLKFWLVAGGFGLFILPVISAATGLLFSYISMKTNAINNKAAQAANNVSSKMMMIVSPLMSLWIGFVMPAALCVYWITNNVLSMLQEFVSGKLLKKDYERAAAAQAERERLEKEEEKEEKRRKAEERARRLEEEKNNRGKKKKAEKKEEAEDKDKIPASVKEASRVGLRQYARGRAYDPYRYSQDGPTPYYGDPDVKLKETQQAKELEKESDQLERVAFEVAADEAIVESIVEENQAAQPAADQPVDEQPSDEEPAGEEAPQAEDGEGESEDKENKE
jgi:YidC/Oxa1 family membrane protein insertase